MARGWWTSPDTALGLVTRIAKGDDAESAFGAAYLGFHAAGDEVLKECAADPSLTMAHLPVVLGRITDHPLIGPVCESLDVISGRTGYGAERLSQVKRDADRAAMSVVTRALSKSAPVQYAALLAAGVYGVPEKYAARYSERVWSSPSSGYLEITKVLGEKELLEWVSLLARTEAGESVSKALVADDFFVLQGGKRRQRSVMRNEHGEFASQGGEDDDSDGYFKLFRSRKVGERSKQGAAAHGARATQAATAPKEQEAEPEKEQMTEDQRRRKRSAERDAKELAEMQAVEEVLGVHAKHLKDQAAAQSVRDAAQRSAKDDSNLAFNLLRDARVAQVMLNDRGAVRAKKTEDALEMTRALDNQDEDALSRDASRDAMSEKERAERKKTNDAIMAARRVERAFTHAMIFNPDEPWHTSIEHRFPSRYDKPDVASIAHPLEGIVVPVPMLVRMTDKSGGLAVGAQADDDEVISMYTGIPVESVAGMMSNSDGRKEIKRKVIEVQGAVNLFDGFHKQLSHRTQGRRTLPGDGGATTNMRGERLTSVETISFLKWLAANDPAAREAFEAVLERALIDTHDIERDAKPHLSRVRISREISDERSKVDAASNLRGAILIVAQSLASPHEFGGDSAREWAFDNAGVVTMSELFARAAHETEADSKRPAPAYGRGNREENSMVDSLIRGYAIYATTKLRNQYVDSLTIPLQNVITHESVIYGTQRSGTGKIGASATTTNENIPDVRTETMDAFSTVDSVEVKSTIRSTGFNANAMRLIGQGENSTEVWSVNTKRLLNSTAHTKDPSQGLALMTGVLETQPLVPKGFRKAVVDVAVKTGHSADDFVSGRGGSLTAQQVIEQTTSLSRLQADLPTDRRA